MSQLSLVCAAALVVLRLPLTAAPNAADVASQFPKHQVQQCKQPSGSSIRVSRDSIGYLGTGLALDSLLTLCSEALATFVLSPDSHPSPALEFRFDGLTAWAVQYRTWAAQFEKKLQPALPADYWILSGRSGELPNGVKLSSTWRELQTQYGEAYNTDDVMVIVSFCRMPWLEVILDTDPNLRLSYGMDFDVAAIPPDTPIFSVIVRRFPTSRIGDNCGQ
ncbi:MAG: hypothetical protein ACE5HT_11895 [Gemmatimonadales bacterium]